VITFAPKLTTPDLKQPDLWKQLGREFAVTTRQEIISTARSEDVDLRIVQIFGEELPCFRQLDVDPQTRKCAGSYTVHHERWPDQLIPIDLLPLLSGR